MSARRFTRGKPPTVCVFLVVCVGEQLCEGFAEVETGSSKDAGELAERCLPSLECGGIAHMENHAGGNRRGGVLPVAFLRTVFSGTHEHIRHVLSVRNIAVRKEANLGEWIKSRGT